MNAPAYRADGAEVGAERFYAIACDPQRNVVVEACAGAGKTWMLVSRILRALLEDVQPQEILAITFTRKAAGEMRDRLALWLREFSAAAATPAQREQALRERGVPPARCAELAQRLAGLQRSLLEGGRPVEICTFHAWFAQLLRAAPLELIEELGLQADAALLEDLDEHRPELMRRFHAALLREPEARADHAALIARRGRSQATRWFETVLQRRVEFELADRAGVLDSSVLPAAPPGVPPPPVAVLDAGWSGRLRRLAVALGAGGKKAQDAAAGLVDALAITDDAEARFEAVWQALFTTAGTPRKLGTVAGLDEAQQALQQLAAQRLQQHAHDEHAAMVRLSRLLLAEYAAYKRSRGLIDMNDLERGALALLRDATLSGWVQERLDARIRQVLIDEFQDTSPLQWHALHAWLSGYAGAGGGQRTPALFIVGDPKQSIYRFRRAEPRVFAAVREFVVAGLGGSVLECDHTRRNAPGVLEAVNAVFAAAQAEGSFDTFRAHTTTEGAAPGPALALLARVPRPAATKTPAPVETAWRDSLTRPRHEPEELLREQEARAVACSIAAALAAGRRAGQIMVLSRKRESLHLVAQALLALGLPFAAVEEHPLLESPEVQDLIALLDALASPAHRLSLARALRSPLFGAGDDELVALARAAQPLGGDWWQALLSRPPAGAALQRAAGLLPRWRELAQRLPPHDLLDRIVAEGELRERYAAALDASRRAAALDSIDALLAQSLLLDAGRYATPYGFVRALKRRALRVAAPLRTDAVQLLTVHGAKGLEAHLVYVMDADPEPRSAETATLLVDWPVEAAAPRCCAFLYAESRCPPELQELLDAERRARRREELNGLYVAMTRARQALVFSATQPSYPDDGGPSWWQRVEALGELLPPPAEVAPVHAVSAPILLPVLPALPPAPDAAAATAPPAADTAIAALGQAVHRLLEWAADRPGELAALAPAAAAEFGAAAGEVQRIAAAILASPACARFFAGPALRWAGNEVPLGLDGQVLRLDRLVRIDEAGASVWWVLDYKLSHRPQALAAYREQLARYRDAVRAAQPGEPVRAAFITGDGSLVELA